MSDRKYVYGDLYDLGNEIGIAEDYAHTGLPALTWDEVRSSAERDLVEQIESLQKELVRVRNLTEEEFRRRHDG